MGWPSAGHHGKSPPFSSSFPNRTKWVVFILVSYILLFYSILICLFMRQCVALLCSIDSITFVYVYWSFPFRFVLINGFYFWPLYKAYSVFVPGHFLGASITPVSVNKWQRRCIGLPAGLLPKRIRLVLYWWVTVSSPVSTVIVAHMARGSSMADLTHLASLCPLCLAGGGPPRVSQWRCHADIRGTRH